MFGRVSWAWAARAYPLVGAFQSLQEAAMSPENIAELTQILAAMKTRGADRAELSRQAANAMFFKWGVSARTTSPLR